MKALINNLLGLVKAILIFACPQLYPLFVVTNVARAVFYAVCDVRQALVDEIVRKTVESITTEALSEGGDT